MIMEIKQREEFASRANSGRFGVFSSRRVAFRRPERKTVLNEVSLESDDSAWQYLSSLVRAMPFEHSKTTHAMLTGDFLLSRGRILVRTSCAVLQPPHRAAGRPEVQSSGAPVSHHRRWYVVQSYDVLQTG